MNMLETEFALYQSLQPICLPVGCSMALHLPRVSGSETAHSKFHNLSMVTRLVPTLLHSITDKEQVFSHIGKNKSKF